MDTKPRFLPPKLATSNVLAFARKVSSNDSPLAKKLKAMSAAHAAFWRDDAMQFEQLRKKHGGAKALKLMQAARAVVDEFTLKAGQPNYALAVVVAERDQGKQKAKQKASAKKRSENKEPLHARIRAASAAGQAPKQIADDEDLSVSQVRKILKATTKTRV
jgi:hypothetical protein